MLGLLMQGEWPLPQPRPNDALRRLLDGDEPTTASPSAPASANANASANTNANDENTNYYVEYMLRPGALGASETARFRNAAQLVRRQHDRLAEQVSLIARCFTYAYSSGASGPPQPPQAPRLR